MELIGKDYNRPYNWTIRLFVLPVGFCSVLRKNGPTSGGTMAPSVSGSFGLRVNGTFGDRLRETSQCTLKKNIPRPVAVQEIDTIRREAASKGVGIVATDRIRARETTRSQRVRAVA